MFFGGRLLDPDCWKESIITFFAFSLIASAIYCLNDILDIEADRIHPKKRIRPIASGKITVAQAYGIFMTLVIAGLTLSLSVLSTATATAGVTCILILYLVTNIAYCLKFKQYAIIDVFIISFGFVLRLFAGGIACQIWLSPWIVCLTFLLALFLAFAKRRDDVVIREKEGVVTRKNTIRYNLPFMNQTLGIIASVTIVCYIMYSVSPEVERRLDSQYIYATSIFVLAGILRYLQVAIVDLNCGSPTKVLLKDRFIQCCIACWGLLFIAILYL